jgi:hypothetical protein
MKKQNTVFAFNFPLLVGLAASKPFGSTIEPPIDNVAIVVRHM